MESSPPGSPNKRRRVAATGIGGPKAVKLGKLRHPKFSSGTLSRFTAPGAQMESKVGKRDESESEEEIGTFGAEEVEGQGKGEQDMMVLDEDGYLDGDLEEMFKDASQIEEMLVDGEAEERDDTNEEAEQAGLGQGNPTPLFLPNPGLDSILIVDESADDQVHKDIEEDAEREDVDENFAEESENLGQSSIRAQKLLEEVEEAAQPTSKGLERAFQSLEGSQTNSTKNIVRTYPTSIAKLRQQSKTLLSSCVGLDSRDTSSSSLTLIEDDVSAEARLNLAVSKKDFFEMQVKGQFNKGFILAARGEDLFIIDQHASDEKYNFETLQQETVVQNQRLVVPKTLELMAMEEVIVTEHLDLFKKNGFVIDVDPEAPTGAKCKLVSLPLSKETVFGIKDLEELIHLVHENQGNSSVRCSKIRSMFAMRACKKSIKVGRALTIKGMEKIVRHMVCRFSLRQYTT